MYTLRVWYIKHCLNIQNYKQSKARGGEGKSTHILTYFGKNLMLFLDPHTFVTVFNEVFNEVCNSMSKLI